MSTRAVLVVEDRNGNAFSIYKHGDGNPKGMAVMLVEAMQFAWPLPRFEAMDWSAAFIAANKTVGGGSVYNTFDPTDHKDLDHLYYLGQAKNGQLVLQCISYYVEEKVLFYGRLKDFVSQYGNTYAKELWNELVPSKNPLTVASAA